MTWVCLVALISAIALHARAADYFVAPDGADGSGDGSMARPFATVERALSSAQPGDRVVLRGGEYRLAQTQRFPRGGEPGRPITLVAYRDEYYGDEYAALLGSVRLTEWEPCGGGLWKCPAPADTIKGLYEDSERLVHPRQRGVRENPPAAAVEAPGRWTVENGWVYLRTRGGDPPGNHRIEASQHGVIELNRPWLRVEKLHVFFGQPTGLVISADHCEAVDCEVAHVSNSVDNAYAAYIASCSNSALRRCIVHDSYYWGDHGSNSHLVSCIDCGDTGPNFVDACEIFNGGLGVGTKGAAREMVVTGCHIYDVRRGVRISGQRSSGPGAGKTDRGHYLVRHNRIHDADVGVCFYSGNSHQNRILGNLFQRCQTGIELRKYHGVPEKPLLANNVFTHCAQAIFADGDRQGQETLTQFAAGGLRSHHNLFFDNGVDWRNPLTWGSNLDQSHVEIHGFGDFGWEEGSIGADPLLDQWGRAREGSPTIDAGAPLELPDYIDDLQNRHIGLGPWKSGEARPYPVLTLSIAGSPTTLGPGEELKLHVVLKNELDRANLELPEDCIVTMHFRYAGVWYFDRQEIWRVRVQLPSRRLPAGESVELSALEGWRNPTQGRPGDPFHLRTDDPYWAPGVRLRATARFVSGDEPTADALQRLEPLLRSSEVLRLAVRPTAE